MEYNTDESENKKIDVDEAICFSYDNSNVTSKYDCEPTPLTVAPEDIKCGFTFPSKVDAANMIATEVSNLDENTDLNIEVTDTNLGIDQILSGKIIIDGENEYPLHYNEKGKLVGTVPFSDLEDKESFFYQATIFDGTNTAKTQERQVVIHKDAKTGEITSDKVLGLSMGADDYVTKPYNTAELMARIKSQLRRYFSLGSAAKSQEDIIVNGGLVLNKHTKSLQVDGEDVHLTATEYKIVELLMSNMGYVFSAEEIYDKEKATYQAQLTVPADSPKVVDHTGTAFDNSTESFPFSVEAFSNETTIKTVMLYLKNNNQSQFESYKLVRSGENQFEKVLSNVDLLNKKNFTYYFEVSDGYSTIQTEEKEIYNTDAEIMESLNLKDGDIVTDKQQIIANGNQLQIDGVDVSEKSQKSINGNGKIAFEATDTDVFFKNAVAVDGEVVGIAARE